MKSAIVTGISGQDGAYLAEPLLSKGCQVYGACRRTSLVNFWRIEELGIADHSNLHLVGYEGMWRMVQADEPETYVLATNRTETVRDFVKMAFAAADVEVAFAGVAEGATALDVASGKVAMRINPRFYRAAEVDLLIGNPAKARAEIGWEPMTSLEVLCEMMVDADLRRNRADRSH